MQKPAIRKSVRVSTEIARGESLPTLTKTKGFRALLLLAESKGAVKRGDIYEVEAQTLRELLRCNDDEHLMAEMEALAGLKVNWSRVDPSDGGYSIPVSSCKWGQKGIIRFAFDPVFVEAWQDNRLGFRRITWEVLVSFRSLYAAKIYEYVCISHERGKVITTKRQDIAALRDLLGVPVTAYQGNSGRLHQEITKAVQQVNDAQDGIRVGYCKEGYGKSARYWFEIEDAPRQTRIPLSSAVTVSSGQTRRERIATAMAALPEDRRGEIEKDMAREGFGSVPSDDLNLKVYAGRLRNYGVSI